MKLFAAALVGLALVASPVLAQQDNTMSPDQKATSTTTRHVHTTTRHIHATNVPVRHHHAMRHHRARHHAMRCGCPPTHHMAMHHMHTHHIRAKTTATAKTPG
jgi:hypothetical protein